jgi:large subunit ribosomal protein L1
MKKYSKKHRKALATVEKDVILPVSDALSKVVTTAYAKFDESVTANIMLGIDPEKGEQAVRGTLVLPHFFGKPVRVIAFAKGDQAEQALKEGAVAVGAEDLVEKILGGWMEFDTAVATPDLMGLVGKTAKILGPRGMLPNKKNNTVALDLAPIIRELKSGLLFFKNDKQGQVNFTFGKVSLGVEKLQENLHSFLGVLSASRPEKAKGIFLKKISVSSTMGPGFALDTSVLNK